MFRLVVKQRQVLETTKKECERDDGWACYMYPDKERKPSKTTIPTTHETGTKTTK